MNQEVDPKDGTMHSQMSNRRLSKNMLVVEFTYIWSQNL